jgi:O-acetyl-ADP-ribose deacetylase (regulator of RNase III)
VNQITITKFEEMNKLNYVVGDATEPQGDGLKVIAHVCNDIGVWGAGFVLALSKKWPHPEAHYRSMSEYVLGDVRLVPVEENFIWVANMIGQHDTHQDEQGHAPIRYSAIAKALQEVNKFCVATKATLHCPMFGAGLAGGDWNMIERLIKECTTVPVTIYELP